MDKTGYRSIAYFAAGILIMLAFRLIPPGLLPEVTKVGLEIIGIFVGTIFLWTTIDPLVASMTSIFMIAVSAFDSCAGVLSTCFGNPTVVQMLFLMIFIGCITNRKVTLYIARWIMSRKIIEGRPWIFTLIMMIGAYVMAVFVGCFIPIFLFWPVLYDVYKQVGYKKTDAYPKVMTFGIVIAALIGFPVPPWMGNGLALLGNYRGLLANFKGLTAMEGAGINNGVYFVVCFLMGLVLICAAVLTMRFVFRPDVTALKRVTVEMLQRNPLPPMSFAQKVSGIALVIFILAMLLPSFFQDAPILGFLFDNSYVIPMVGAAILCLILTEDGPVLRIGEVMGELAWPTFFLCTSAILLGSVLTNESTGVTAFLSTVLSPIFTNMTVSVFTVVMLIVTVLLTNICNSLVIGMILQPVVLTYCAGAGANPAPLITLLIFTVLLSAACTPAASPFAAMLFANKEYLRSSDVYKYSTVTVAVELVLILVLGIPFVNLFL